MTAAGGGTAAELVWSWARVGVLATLVWICVGIEVGGVLVGTLGLAVFAVLVALTGRTVATVAVFTCAGFDCTDPV